MMLKNLYGLALMIGEHIRRNWLMEGPVGKGLVFNFSTHHLDHRSQRSPFQLRRGELREILLWRTGWTGKINVRRVAVRYTAAR